jgi:uncharacterized membrane protein YdbT with pleckstrin-like domain
MPTAPAQPTHTAADDSAPLPQTLSPEYVASMVPRELLHGDEVVLILTKPSLWFIVLTSFRFVLTAILLGVLAVRILSMPSYNYLSPPVIASITTAICLGRLVWALLVWTSHVYLLTNRRLVTIKGVINVHMVQANLRKIQRTTLYRPWLFRIFGIGTIGIATAATESFDATWVMIAHPLPTHEQIVAAINKVQ